MNKNQDTHFPKAPNRFLTDKENSDALRIWNYLSEVYDESGLAMDLTSEKLELYCDVSQRINSFIKTIYKSSKKKNPDILKDMEDLKFLKSDISLQKSLATGLSLPKALKIYKDKK